MVNIYHTVNQFIEAWKDGRTIVLREDGEWYVERAWFSFAKRFLGRADDAMIKSAANFTRVLDSLEQTAISYGSENQKVNFQSYIQAAIEIIKSLDSLQLQAAKDAGLKLQRRLIALEYRLEGVNGGLDKCALDLKLLKELESAGSYWKSAQAIFAENKLTKHDKNALKHASSYPKFGQLILDDRKLREDFFVWVFRDKMTAGPFIEFPAMQEQLTEIGLNGRIGRINGKMLEIRKERISERVKVKILSLPFEGKPCSILDEKQSVELSGNYKLSIKEVFEIFNNKKISPEGSLEFLAEGIVNWNPYKLGRWNASSNQYDLIDINQPGWWKQLPFFEVLSKSEAQSRYGAHMDGVVWNAAPSATRGSATLDFLETHAFLEVAIPIGKGKYAIYDFGKFASRFPASLLEGFATLGQTFYATVAFPDENVYYSHRQHARQSYALTPKQGMQLMDDIKRDIVLGRVENFVYQIESDNCAMWVQEKLDNLFGKGCVGDLFKIDLLETEPMGVVKWIFKAIKAMPAFLQIPVLTFCHIPMGAAKGVIIIEKGDLVMKSLSTHLFWTTGVVYLPALFVKRVVEGVLRTVGLRGFLQSMISIDTMPINSSRPFKCRFSSTSPDLWHTSNTPAHSVADRFAIR